MVKDEEGTRWTTFVRKMQGFSWRPQQSSGFISLSGIVSQAPEGWLPFSASEEEGSGEEKCSSEPEIYLNNFEEQCGHLGDQAFFLAKCDFIKRIISSCGGLYFVFMYWFLLQKVSPKINFSDQAQISLKENFYSRDSFIIKKIWRHCKFKKKK